ncbi:MAG TPA: hypothetical protein VHK91_15930 [Flavisolibacter sp.]|jgi:hypothetical protein|nr:hypothetical protein [Flavisolibacter sp.]
MLRKDYAQTDNWIERNEEAITRYASISVEAENPGITAYFLSKKQELTELKRQSGYADRKNRQRPSF